MEHINRICKEQGYPLLVENSPTLGNHAVAERDIPQGEGLLRAIPYAADVFDNYKKRMCHVCLLYHNKGSFDLRCQECDQVYFCSQICKDIAMGTTTTTTTTMITTTPESVQENDINSTSATGIAQDEKPLEQPSESSGEHPSTIQVVGYHPKICKTLRKLATWNSDRHTKSIIKLLLQVLLNHWKERQGIPTAYQYREMYNEQQKKQKALDVMLAQVSLNDKKEHLEQNETMAPGEAIEASQPQKEQQQQPQKEEELQQQHHHQHQQHQDTDDCHLCQVQHPIENDFSDVLRLQSHFEDWSEEDHKDWNKQSQVVLGLLQLCGLTEIETKESGLQTITAVDIKRMISALESNAFGMFDRSKSKPICFGRAIYPIASFFNHSCECNATAVQADGSEGEITGDMVVGAMNTTQEPAPAPPPTPPTSTTRPNQKGQKKKSGKGGGRGGRSTPQTADKTLSKQSTTASASIPDENQQEEPEASTAEADVFKSIVGEFRMMTFFAIRDILKGQDITISYIDTEMPLQARRLALLTDYWFHCCCVRCVREELAAAPGANKKMASASKTSTHKKKKTP
ncbi:hypothetical protein BGZ94_007531 [Podila epigama]|nr:hypothetical protein BGZ94_007531 [Podila epigama]